MLVSADEKSMISDDLVRVESHMEDTSNSNHEAQTFKNAVDFLRSQLHDIEFALDSEDC